MKKKSLSVLTIIMAVLFFISSSLNAQVNTGTLAGYITDDMKAPLPGATVTASSSITVGARKVVTDLNGYYNLRALPPGKYKIVVELEGFNKMTRTSIEVNVAAVVRLDLVMVPKTVEEEIVVTAPAPVIETEKTTMDTVITSEMLEAIPILGRDFMAAIKLLPGVTDSNYGVSISGGRDTQKNYNIDGTDNIDIVQGKAYEGGGYGLTMNQPFMDFDQEAIQELSVATAGYSAEHGFGSAGLINVVTKSGSNDFHGSLYLYARNDKWDYEVPYAYEDYIFGGSLGGPIIKDKLLFFTSHRPSFNKTGYDTRSSLYAGVPEHLRDKSKGYTGFFKFTFKLSEKNTLNVSSNIPWYSSEWYVTLWHVDPDFPKVTTSTGGVSVTMADTAIISQNLLLESTLSIGRTTEDFINEPGVHPGLIIDLGPFTATGSYNGDEIFKKTKINWYERVNIFVPDWGGSHNIISGFEVRYNSSDDHREITESIYTYPSYYPWYYPSKSTTISGPTDLKLSQTYISGYVNDSWSPRKNLTLKLGVRLSMNTYLSKLLVEPRFGLAWDPIGDSKTVIRMGGNIYRDRINSYIQQMDNYPLSTYVDTYRDGYVDEVKEGYRSTVIDENFINPRTTELNFGIDREIITNLWLSASFIYRKYDDQLFTYSINLRNPVTRQRPDPTKGALTFYTNNGYCDYKGLQLVLGKRFSHGFQFLISYSYQVSVGNSQLFTDFSQLQSIFRSAYLMEGDPQIADFSGKTTFDKPYDFKAFASVVLPLDFVLAGVFTLTAGSPYTEYNRQTRELVSDFMALRSPDLMNIDLRVEKDFKIKGTVVKFMVEAFNLTNRDNIKEVRSDVSASDYNEPYRIGPSRRVQLGFRFQW